MSSDAPKLSEGAPKGALEGALREAARLRINDDAVFVADAHWKAGDEGLLACLDSLQCSQVFLMGDIAQMLVGNLATSTESNKALLECIQNLSKRSCVYWLEGNHDFGLEALGSALAQVRFIPRARQPLIATYRGQIVSLAHGDLFLNKRYRFYIGVLNSRFGLSVLKAIDWLSRGWVYRVLQAGIDSKHIRAFRGEYEGFCARRIQSYSAYFLKRYKALPQIIIEGHFHLGREMWLEAGGGRVFYACLPSFYIDGSIFRLQSGICQSQTRGKNG